MTRIAVLADIHGNLPALHAVLDHMPPVDQVVVAGDLVNWGPFSREVVALALEEHWSVVRGNNAFYMLEHNSQREPEGWHDFLLPAWLSEQLTEFHPVIAGWPDAISLRYRDAPPVRMHHGIPGNPWEAIFPETPVEEAAAILAPVAEDVVICGHSHIAMARQIGRWQVINPGSVGVPLDGDPRAGYALMEGGESGWRVTHHRVAYDRATLFAEFERIAFRERFGPSAHFIIREFDEARLRLHPFYLWRTETYPGQPESWAMVEEFERSVDPIPYMREVYR